MPQRDPIIVAPPTAEELNKQIKKSKRKVVKEEGYLTDGGNGLYKANSILNVAKKISDDKVLCDMWRYNELLNDIEYAKTPPWNHRIKASKTVDDGDIIFLTSWIADKYKFEPPEKTIRGGLFLDAQKKYYHPIKDYLENLEWDGVPRLNEFLSRMLDVTNNAYYKCVGRKLICSMITRVYDPGCQMDYMIILEGKEGIYKTTMLKILAGQWYAPFTGITHQSFEKDAVDIMRGKWLLEMAELTAVRRIEDFNRIKAFISCTEDRVRLSYRHDAGDYKRQCVLVGTMNPVGDNTYFRDPGENRRFWPVECENHINIEWLKENRDNLFAEGMQVYKEEKLYLDDEEALKISIEKQEVRKPTDAWVDIINDWLIGKDTVTPQEVAGDCLSFTKEKMTLSVLQRIGNAMRDLRWEVRRLYVGRERKKVYVRPGYEVNIIDGKVDAWDNE